jgi:protein-S-isoprenylcysteine O-methyltransferase Ste14
MNKAITIPKIMPPLGLLIAVLSMLGLHYLYPVTQVVPRFWPLFGLFPLGLGLALSYAAENQFRRASTTVQPFEESSQLVVDGLYCYSRNPMYLGMALILLGVAFLLGSLTPFGMIVLFVIWIHFQFIRREERMLFTQFGQDWLEYKEKVRCWI